MGGGTVLVNADTNVAQATTSLTSNLTDRVYSYGTFGELNSLRIWEDGEMVKGLSQALAKPYNEMVLYWTGQKKE